MHLPSSDVVADVIIFCADSDTMEIVWLKKVPLNF